MPHAMSEDSQNSSETVQHAEKTVTRMSQTLGNLDALLGIEEEKKEEAEETTKQAKVYTLLLLMHNLDAAKVAWGVGCSQVGALRPANNQDAMPLVQVMPALCDTFLPMQAPQIDVGVSPEVLRQIAEAEAKVAGKESSPQSLKDIERQMVHLLPVMLLCILSCCWRCQRHVSCALPEWQCSAVGPFPSRMFP